MQGEISYFLGDFTQACEQCEQGLAFLDPQQHHSHSFLFGTDTGIGRRIFHAQSLWHLGYPDQARAMNQEALDQARALSHPFTLVFALYFYAIFHQLCREPDAVQEQAQALLHISREHGFALYLATGTVLRGWALAGGYSLQEPAGIEEGIGQMCEGIAALRAMGAAAILPSSLASLVQAYGQIGEIGQALDLLDEALDLVEETGERVWEAELYRLRAELLLMQGDEAGAEASLQAENSYQQAIEVARRQHAKSWELRATASLARLWRKQGRVDEARQMLAEIYDWFTEGYDTADLREARTLLGELSSSSRLQST
jgi:predicted ATPase